MKYLIEGVSIFVGVLIVALNLLYIAEANPMIGTVLNIVGALIALVPPVFTFYSRFRTAKEIDQQFIVFLMDLTEAIDSGMTLPMALKHCARKDYRTLTPHIKGISAQVDWGVSFKDALSIFSKNIASIPVKRAIGTILETYEVGGKITDTLKAVGGTLIEINKIKEERSVSVHSQILTSYLIFFVFIFILVVLQTFLLPALSGGEVPGIGTPMESAIPIEVYSQGFMNFIIIQGFFAGLATGKMAEGSIVAGLKHSVVLIIIGYTIFSFAGQITLPFFPGMEM
jgi:flagellar protein FlaJ